MTHGPGIKVKSRRTQNWVGGATPTIFMRSSALSHLRKLPKACANRSQAAFRSTGSDPMPAVTAIFKMGEFAIRSAVMYANQNG